MTKQTGKASEAKQVSCVWNIDNSAVPVNVTIREMLRTMVAQHPDKDVSVCRVYTNYELIGGLVCQPRTKESVTIMCYDSRIPTMSPIRSGVYYIEVDFKIQDKPAK